MQRHGVRVGDRAISLISLSPVTATGWFSVCCRLLPSWPLLPVPQERTVQSPRIARPNLKPALTWVAPLSPSTGWAEFSRALEKPDPSCSEAFMPQSQGRRAAVRFGATSPAAAAGAGSQAASTASAPTHPPMPHLRTKPSSSVCVHFGSTPTTPPVREGWAETR